MVGYRHLYVSGHLRPGVCSFGAGIQELASHNPEDLPRFPFSLPSRKDEHKIQGPPTDFCRPEVLLREDAHTLPYAEEGAGKTLTDLW